MSNWGHLSSSRRGRRCSCGSSSRSLGGLLSRLLSRLLGGLGGGRGSSFGRGSSSILGGGGLGRGVILLAGGVNRDLNGDLSALDLLAVHLVASLLLELLRAEGDEPETTALARLTTSLELLDHEAGNGAEGDLGLGGGVVLEDLEELHMVSTQCSNSRRDSDVPCPP